MKTLTLDEVQEAGRYAECSQESDGVWSWNPDDEDLILYLPLIAAHLGCIYRVPLDRWHHIKGCNCEFCRS